MGRKIPAKKHRGVKDPVKQHEQRLKKLKNKINAPPSDPDDQPVPKSLERLFAPRGPAPRPTPLKPHDNKPQKQKKRGAVHAMPRLGGESAREFAARVSGAVQALHGDETYPDEEAESGSTRRRRPPAAPRAPRPHRLDVKRRDRKERAQQETAAARAELRYERVPFGETADAPPALSAPRHAKAGPATDRPGGRPLLLHALVAEAARRQAVDAYRQLKASGGGGAAPGRGRLPPTQGPAKRDG